MLHRTEVRLADFIVANRESIMVEWEDFARSCAPASAPMDVAALRDHASQMLTAFVADLRQPQDDHEQAEKALGNAAVDSDAAPTAAASHGDARAASGFTIDQMFAEYRALRASVLRLWTHGSLVPAPTDLSDITRFNEAVDQAIAESVNAYSTALGHSRDRFIGILGHDLRSPLSTVIMSAKFMLETGDLVEPCHTLTKRIVSSSTRMVAMVGDLLDFTRSRLGDGIPIAPTPLDMTRLLLEVVEEVRSAHPTRTIVLTARGPVNGEWDGARIRQAVTNLLSNALAHGSSSFPVTVTLTAEYEAVSIVVHNAGVPIAPSKLPHLFDPMQSSGTGSASTMGPGANLGLGLFIVERIVHAHGGTVAVESSQDEGTSFTVRLPIQGRATD